MFDDQLKRFMKIKANNTNLKKLEQLFGALGYKIIYEKGQFNAGYCIVNDKKIIVINRFFKNDARFHCLSDILNELALDSSNLDEAQKTFYQGIIDQGK